MSLRNPFTNAIPDTLHFIILLVQNVNFCGRKVSPTLEYVLAILELNTDIFGCKGVYYPRSKLFSRQSKPKRTHYNPIKSVSRMQFFGDWYIDSKNVVHRCISQIRNCAMAILSDFFFTVIAWHNHNQKICNQRLKMLH